MLENYPALLLTKVYIPRLRSSHVSRDALLNLLEADHKLILVAAAAGFGKTTLVADWSSQHVEAVSWLSLDEGDNDPIRFLSYLIAAIQTRRPQIGQELLAALQSPQPPTIENALSILINQLTSLPERLFVVLDDYHVIENTAIHQMLIFLLDYLPSPISVILLSRSDPSLPLARLRAKNDLLELRADKLRFSVEETAYFLNQVMQLGLSSEAIAALETRTEGWIAGLQLAALAMQPIGENKQAFVQNFTGSHRFILDYLIEEVLSHQSENTRRFLLETSILQRLNGDLCGTVTNEPDGQTMIEHLEKNNLFIIPLDQSRTWYRYHHLFADLLRARLQAETPDKIKALNQRAAGWHEQNGYPEEAVAYALAAQDFDHAAHLITDSAVGVMRRSEVNTLLNWYRAFPSYFIENHPRLALSFGLAFALNGRWDEAEHLLASLEKAIERPDEVLLLAYLIASYRQDADQLAQITDVASAHPNPDRITKLVLGLLLMVKGDLHQAAPLMAAAQAESEREGDVGFALTALFHQCRLQVFMGNLHQAHALCQQALDMINTLGGTALPLASVAHTALTRIYIEWDELDKAEHHVLQALHLAELSGFVTGIMSSGTVMLAEIQQARGEVHDTVQTALAYAERYDPQPEVLALKTYQARIWLNQGNVSAAYEWMQEMTPTSMSIFYPTNIPNVTQARVLLAKRKFDDAISLLTKLNSEPQNLLSVEILALLALTRQAQGDSTHAQLALAQALKLAEAENRRRVFLELGAPMAKLLAQTEHPYASVLLALFDEQPSQGIDPLSERELAILRLIVVGYSNDEIARHLTLALSTVKWYINVLYGKLHVKTRSQAIARAHELKLLSN